MRKLFVSIPLVLGSLLALSVSAGLASGHARLGGGPGAVGELSSIASSLDASGPAVEHAGR
jgi:hypothetical protein